MGAARCPKVGGGLWLFMEIGSFHKPGGLLGFCSCFRWSADQPCLTSKKEKKNKPQPPQTNGAGGAAPSTGCRDRLHSAADSIAVTVHFSVNTDSSENKACILRLCSLVLDLFKQLL